MKMTFISVLLLLMIFTTFQASMAEGGSGNMEVTARIEITEIPDELSVFEKAGFSKYVSVFGIHVFATPTTPDDKVLHASKVMAQYLDNDEDGVPDNLLVMSHLVSRNAYLVMTANDEEFETLDTDYWHDAGYHFGQFQHGEETKPGFLIDGEIQAKEPWEYDASLEEVLHLITDHGYGNAYPEVFGTRPGTAVAKCVDAARGGRFTRVPKWGPKWGYPEDSWFHYTDVTCGYGCMISEYVYWALTSILGTQDFEGRHEALANEWELNTRELVKTKDPKIYALLTDSQYKFATRAPDGNYTPSALPVVDVPLTEFRHGDEEAEEEDERERDVMMRRDHAMGRVNAEDYGVVGDGILDNTPNLQAALDAAVTRGAVCYLPAGSYRINGALIIPPGVTLRGASGGVPHSENPIGTVLLAYGGRGDADGEPLITLKPNAVIRNMVIHYPEQTLDIVPYPWTIRGDGELCQVLDMTVTNPYQLLDFGTKWNELHIIRNVFACPLKTGVYIDQCTDIGRVENVHFNPNFWTRMKLEPPFPGGHDKLYSFLKGNLVGFKIGKTDWEYISNSFVIFPLIGFHFDNFGHGPGNAVITQSGSDICPMAVRVDRVQGHAGVQFVNGQFMATFEVGEENRGPVKLTNCGFWNVPETQEHIIKRGPGTLTLTSCHFTGWDSKGAGAPCIRASGGRLVVNGCEFMDEGKKQILLEKGLVAATITGCLLRGDQGIVDNSDADVQIGLNTTH